MNDERFAGFVAATAADVQMLCMQVQKYRTLTVLVLVRVWDSNVRRQNVCALLFWATYPKQTQYA